MMLNQSLQAWLYAGLRLLSFILLAFTLFIAPWAFGCVETHKHALLLSGMGVITLLLGLTLSAGPQIHFRFCWVQTGICFLWLWFGFQLVPLPISLRQFFQPEGTKLLLQLNPDIQTFPISLTPQISQDQFTFFTALALLFIFLRQGWLHLSLLRPVAWFLGLLGAGISILALLQKYSFPPDKMFGIYNVGTNDFFGPFLNRNHFIDAAVFGLSFSIALMLRPRSGHLSKEGVKLGDFFQDPTRLFFAIATILILITSLFSSSRGGILALAFAFCFILFIQYRIGKNRITPIWAVPLLLLPLLAFLPVVDRFEDLTQSSNLRTSRGEHFRAALTLAQQYGWAGAGVSSYEWIEPVTRQKYQLENWVNAYAHNEYLHALVELGLPGLFAVLFIVYYSFHYLMDGLKAARKRSRYPLILAGLFSITVIAIHSLIDFGPHIPAIALLIIVVLAITLNAADTSEVSVTSSSTKWVAGCCFTLFGILLILYGQQWHNREQLRRQAIAGSIDTMAAITQNIALQQSAIQLSPKYGALYAELGQLLLEQANLQAELGLNTAPSFQAAIQAWQIAILYEPLLPTPYLQLALYGEPKLRQMRLQQANLIAPKSPTVAYFYGRELLQIDAFSKLGISKLRDALAANPSLLPRLMQFLVSQLQWNPERITKIFFIDRPILFWDMLQHPNRSQWIADADVPICLTAWKKSLNPLISPADYLAHARLEALLDADTALAKTWYEQAIKQDEVNDGLYLEYLRYLDSIGEFEYALQLFRRHFFTDPNAKNFEKVLLRQIKLQKDQNPGQDNLRNN